MAAEFVALGAQGFNPSADTVYQLTDGDANVFKLKATEDVGFEILRNNVRTQPYKRVVAKTANYTVLLEDHGTFFTTEGAGGAVTFTLPATASLPTGWYADFFVAADQNMTVTAGTADTGVAFNDIAADSVAFSTASEKVGNCIRVIKLTGTLVGYVVQLGAETATPTVAT